MMPVQFAKSFMRCMQKQMVNYVCALYPWFEVAQSSFLRIRAPSLFKTLAERSTALRPLIAKHMLSLMGDSRDNCTKARARTVLACCSPGFGRLGTACVSTLSVAAKNYEKGAWAALKHVLDTEPPNKHPKASMTLNESQDKAQTSPAVLVDVWQFLPKW